MFKRAPFLGSWVAVVSLGLGGVLAAVQGVAQGGRGGIPNLTQEQTAALTQLNADLAGPMQAVTDARTALTTAALAEPRNDAAIQAKADAVKAADLVLAKARADAFAKVQASPNRLGRDQVAALAAMGGGPGGGRGGAGGRGGTGGPGGAGGRGGAGSIPNLTSQQIPGLTQMTGELTPLTQAVNAARGELVAAVLAEPPNDAAVRAKSEAVWAAELALAKARAGAFAKVQASPNKLATDQVAALIAMGGVLTSGSFTEPEPMDFNDHTGYVALFDGVSLKGWDGNPKFWRAEGGAIIGESTPQNPSGNSYLVYRGVEARDFTLKFEIKVEGDGGSGVQYRSKTGVPWLSPIPANVTANVGPVNLNWMMTGPQADFWPSRVYTGQFYSENTPMRIMAWRGQVVEGAGMGTRRLMGTIGDRQALGELVKMNDWNQYIVIARGGTFLHIVNGQLMAVMVDDDPASSNNQSGLIGIEIEAVTKISVRNIWLKKLN
ncbi:MAG TPA: family 16 glycoside hydrolase [Candidatus Acidoferrales bacterium]|nr:family 16 glycoside hydrolase [Candidatus Acidoferrales bacterium]